MKLVDKILLLYSALLAITLTVISFRGGLTAQNLIMMALFLPVTGYFIYLFIRAYLRHRRFKQSLSEVHHIPSGPSFSLKAFFTQKDPLFIITLCLFLSLACALAVKTVTSL